MEQQLQFQVKENAKLQLQLQFSRQQVKRKDAELTRAEERIRRQQQQIKEKASQQMLMHVYDRMTGVYAGFAWGVSAADCARPCHMILKCRSTHRHTVGTKSTKVQTLGVRAVLCASLSTRALMKCAFEKVHTLMKRTRNGGIQNIASQKMVHVYIR